ncbi:uncharacterized protein [Montipora foliosa]|uniref:uncharacterized protein n=1 Tax=Montipora foliosa TaxID=591990 RepID=UPI0035F1538E
MATPSDRALHATNGKANFQRLTRLLMCGGITLLREVFDSILPPTDLQIKLGDATIKAQLQKLTHQKALTKPEWNKLYPSPGVYGKSRDYDITLLFKLFRNLCGLTPPGTGWNELPNLADLSLEADLVRIKYYRNEVYGHSTTMEIADQEFVDIWREISEALLRIAGNVSSEKRSQWQKSIDAFLHDPLTPDAKRYIAELDCWYKNDMVLKDELVNLRNEMKQMKVEQQEELKKITIRIFIETFTPCRRGSFGPVSTGHFPSTPQPQEARLQPASVCVPISSQESQTEGVTAGESTHTELQANRQTSSTVLDFWQVVFSFKKSIDMLIEYLRMKLGLDVVNSRPGSLLITVSCSSLGNLKRLWEDYRSGHLSEVVQKILVTPEILEELNVSEVTLKTIIMKDEYKEVKLFLKNRSGFFGRKLSKAPPTVIVDKAEGPERIRQGFFGRKLSRAPRTVDKAEGPERLFPFIPRRGSTVIEDEDEGLEHLRQASSQSTDSGYGV